MPHVFVLSGTDVGRSFAIEPGARLGRSPECDVRLRDTSVSRHHAHFELREGRWTIVDDGSRNGVIVAGHKVPESELTDHQEFHLGELLLRFRLDEPAAPPKSAGPGASATPSAGAGVASDAAPAPGARESAAPGASAGGGRELEDEIVLEGADDELELDVGETLAPKSTTSPKSVTSPKSGRSASPPAAAAPPFPRAAPLAETRVAERSAVETRSAVLQYHKEAERRGWVTSDLTQYPLWVRWCVYASVLALALGLAWLAYSATTGMRERLGGGEAIEDR